MIKCSSFEKEEREKQKWAQDKGICDRIIFVLYSRHHKGVSDLGSIAVLLRGEILG
jgi:hypothetical protein